MITPLIAEQIYQSCCWWIHFQIFTQKVMREITQNKNVLTPSTSIIRVRNVHVVTMAVPTEWVNDALILWLFFTKVWTHFPFLSQKKMWLYYLKIRCPKSTEVQCHHYQSEPRYKSRIYSGLLLKPLLRIANLSVPPLFLTDTPLLWFPASLPSWHLAIYSTVSVTFVYKCLIYWSFYPSSVFFFNVDRLFSVLWSRCSDQWPK